MSTASIPFILLIISILSIVLLIFYVLSKRPLAQLQKSFLAMLMCVFVISFGVLIQDIFMNYTNIEPIYFEYFIYIGTCLLPIAVFFTALIFKNTKIKFENARCIV